MLCRLILRDFVIVDHLELAFEAGFGTLTGETGAGKSILVDALTLVLGERAEAGVVRAGAAKAEVAAVFDLSALPAACRWLDENDFEDNGELLLRRVVDSGGRSRAYINGAPATVQQLREAGAFLVDIHGQHAYQSLLRTEAQRALLDAQGGLTALAQEVAAAFHAWRSARQALQTAVAGGEALAREREQLEWQVREVAALAFSAHEWGELEEEHRRLAHAASLIEGVQFALAVLADGESACDGQIGNLAGRLENLAGYDASLEAVTRLVQSAQAELAEAISLLRRYADRAETDPARLTEVESRIEAIHNAARKYRCTPELLPEQLESWRARLAELEADADIAALEARAAAAGEAYRTLAARLSTGRRESAVRLSERTSALMAQLALASGSLEIALLPVEEAAHGQETVEFRVRGLAGSQALPLAKVASGGELSRISLAIQVVASRSAGVPTLVFDEVDVGIGGGVAEVVGRLLHELGRERQVLCVTHLPQVAARADRQWRVSKSTRDSDGAVLSHIEALDAPGRIEEIARMLGGVEITGITRRHAKELLGRG